jgi:hypothetical protein
MSADPDWVNQNFQIYISNFFQIKSCSGSRSDPDPDSANYPDPDSVNIAEMAVFVHRSGSSWRIILIRLNSLTVFSVHV